MIGHLDGIEMPAEGARIKKGDPLFSVRQGRRVATFHAPVSGVVQSLNTDLPHHLDWLEQHTYDNGWVCSMKPDQLADDLALMKIGDRAAAWYQMEIVRLQQLLAPASDDATSVAGPIPLVEGQLQEADDKLWAGFTQTFLQPQSAAPGTVQ
jgi:glycine cleavage system H lipoate-binding protein